MGGQPQPLVAATIIQASKLKDLQTGFFFGLRSLDETGTGVIYNLSLCASIAGQEERARHGKLDLLYTVTDCAGAVLKGGIA